MSLASRSISGRLPHTRSGNSGQSPPRGKRLLTPPGRKTGGTRGQIALATFNVSRPRAGDCEALPLLPPSPLAGRSAHHRYLRRFAGAQVRASVLRPGTASGASRTAVSMARVAGDHHRTLPDPRVSGVRRPLRGARLESSPARSCRWRTSPGRYGSSSRGLCFWSGRRNAPEGRSDFVDAKRRSGARKVLLAEHGPGGVEGLLV
jgi:hypothetical protein